MKNNRSIGGEDILIIIVIVLSDDTYDLIA